MIQLRDYQKIAIEKIDIEFRKGNRRVILWAFPGLGKTEMAIYMMERALSYSFPSLFIVRGRNLVNNASDRMRKNKLDHSVFMAKRWDFDRKKLVQVMSVDTMTARSDYPFKDNQPLILLDEAHYDYSKVFEQYPDAYYIGMTGSPFTDMSDYHSYVCPIEPYEARDMGFLVQDKIYCPHVVDVSAVKMTAGDFNKKQLNSVVTESAVVGNVVKDWLELGQNRPTVVFASSIEHSLQLKQAFCDAGVKAIHCDASSSDEERKKARAGLYDGTIKVITNVDIFSTGWDAPIVSCIVSARPTFSLCWWIQSCMRGMRPHPGKESCIILDNAGNTFRHGTMFKVREISLEKPEKRKSKSYDTKVTTCKKCYFVYDPTVYNECPDCGFKPDVKSRRVNEIDGKLIPYEEGPEETKKRRESMIKKKYYELEWARKKNKLRPDWTFIQLFKSFSRDEMAVLREVTVVPDRFLALPSDLQN